MTIVEMMYEFQSLLDTSVPAYAEQLRLNSDKIMMQLNIGYRRYILEKFLSSRDSNTNALTIQAHQDVLSNLIEVAHLPAVSIGNGELVGIGYSVVLPDNYYYYIRGAVATTRADEIQTSDNSYSNLILTNSYPSGNAPIVFTVTGTSFCIFFTSIVITVELLSGLIDMV